MLTPADFNRSYEQNQHLPPLSSKAPSIPFPVARVVPPTHFGKPIPIQRAFQKLAKEPFFQREEALNVTATRQNGRSVSWTMAKIGALLGTIYGSRVTTEQDRISIEALEQEVKSLRSELNVRVDLSPEEKSFNKKCFRQATKALNELKQLRMNLESSYPAQDQWTEATHWLADCTLSPFFEGEVLLGTPFIQQGMESAEALYEQLKTLPNKSAAKESLKLSYQKLNAEFLETVDEWIGAAVATMLEEEAFLVEELKKPKSEHAIRQLMALRDQQQLLEERLSEMARTDIAEKIGLSDLLKGAIDTFSKERMKLNKILSSYPQTNELKPLKYCSEEWMNLPKAPKKDPVFLEKLMMDPASWSDSKKEAVHALLVGMQLTQQGIEGVQHIKYLKALRREIDQMGQDIPRADMSMTVSEDENQPVSSPFSLQEYLVVTGSHLPGFPWVRQMISSVGSWFSTIPTAPVAPSDFFAAKAERGEEQLQAAMNTLEQQKVETSRDSLGMTQELRQEIALLQREILKTLESKPGGTCPLSTLAMWSQEVSDKCYAVELVEKRIGELMSQVRHTLSAEDAELEQYGKKHENIVKQARLIAGLQLPGLSVPIPHGIKSENVHQFLKKNAPEIFSEWEALGREQATYQGQTPFLEEPQSKMRLEVIEKGIEEAFRKAGADETLFQELVSSELIAWLKGVQDNEDYLMVRSTGAEDSRQTANAGGNKSPAYVSPTPQGFCQAAGEVIISYFGFGSLQNRINAGLNPFEQDLKLAVTAQQLIGEPIGGTPNPQEIPISLVLFTSEPLYVGGEQFRAMRISATRGHGEGVVGGVGIGADTALLLVSEVHPDRLYILYDNADKPVRLAPVQTEKGVELQPVANPEFLRHQPVLNNDLLTRLYTWGVVGEKFFDDFPTDMEIVIKNGVIYPVQARPINRPDLIPTYLDMKRVAALGDQPILDKIQGELLVPGRGSVVVITDPDRVNFATGLKQAEDASHLKQYDVVMVKEPEPANSHPVVNFSGLGMPCLVVGDPNIENLYRQASPDRPVIVDMQTGTVVLWDKSKGDPEESIVKGFAVHPAKIAVSLPVAAKTVQSEKEVPQEIKDFILAIGSANTKEASQESLQALRQHSFVASLKEQQEALSKHRIVVRKVEQTKVIFQELDTRIQEAFDEVGAALNNAPVEARLRPLIHIKVLSSLLTGKGGTGLAQFSRLSVEPLYEEALALIDYQKSLSHPAHFVDLLTMRSEALLPETQQAWVAFLKSLEYLVQSEKIPPQQIAQFKKMLQNLERTGLLPTWFTLFFPKAFIKEGALSFLTNLYEFFYPTPEVFEKLLEALPTHEGPLLDYFLSLNQDLSNSQSQIDLFSNPSTFEKGWQWLQSRVEKVKSQADLSEEATLIGHLQYSSPLSKTLALKVMGQVVETFDLSIKAMKSSSQWSREDKVKIFKKMLGPYLDLLLDWGAVLDTKGITTHGNWPIYTYLAKMKELFEAMPDNDVAHLNPSRDFSVVAAMLGSGTEFSRHYPVHLEDMFTNIHQSLEVILSHMNNLLSLKMPLNQAPIPELLKHMFSHVANEQTFGRSIQRRALEVTKSGVIAKYNIPLRNHSSQMWIQYDKQTGKITMKCFLLGPARTRWGVSQGLLAILEKLGLPLSEPVHIGDQEMNFSWEIKDAGAFAVAKAEWLFLLRMSLEQGLELNALKQLANRRQIPPQDIAEKVLSGLSQRHSPPDLQDLRVYATLVGGDQGIEEAVSALRLCGKNANEKTLAARLQLVRALIDRDQKVEDIAIEIAGEGLLSPDELIQRSSADLITVLMLRKEATSRIIKRAKQGFQSAETKERVASLRLLKEVIKHDMDENGFLKEQGIELAISVASDPNMSSNHLSELVDLIDAVVSHGSGKEIAFQLGARGMQDPDYSIRWKSERLLKNLLNTFTGSASEVTAIAQATFSSDNEFVRYGAVELMEYIVKGDYRSRIKGQNFEPAMVMASQGVKEQSGFIQLKSLQIAQYIIEKHYSPVFADAATLIASQGMQSYSEEVRSISVDIMIEVVGQGYHLETAMALVSRACRDWNGDIRSKGVMLLEKIMDQKQGFPEAIAIAKWAFFTDNASVREVVGFKLMRSIVERGEGIKEVLAMAELGKNDANERIRELTQEILEIIKTKGLSE